MEQSKEGEQGLIEVHRKEQHTLVFLQLAADESGWADKNFSDVGVPEVGRFYAMKCIGISTQAHEDGTPLLKAIFSLAELPDLGKLHP